MARQAVSADGDPGGKDSTRLPRLNRERPSGSGRNGVAHCLARFSSVGSLALLTSGSTTRGCPDTRATVEACITSSRRGDFQRRRPWHRRLSARDSSRVQRRDAWRGKTSAVGDARALWLCPRRHRVSRPLLSQMRRHEKRRSRSCFAIPALSKGSSNRRSRCVAAAVPGCAWSTCVTRRHALGRTTSLLVVTTTPGPYPITLRVRPNTRLSRRRPHEAGSDRSSRD